MLFLKYPDFQGNPPQDRSYDPMLPMKRNIIFSPKYVNLQGSPTVSILAPSSILRINSIGENFTYRS